MREIRADPGTISVEHEVVQVLLRRLLSILAASVMLGASMAIVVPALAMAATQGSCESDDNNKVKLWENSIGDTSGGNDALWKCTSDGNLGDDDHTIAGDCNRPFPEAGNWNDCVSSFTVYVSANWKLCLYQDSGYDTLKATYFGSLTGTRYDAGALWDDKLTSFSFTQQANNCP